MLESVVCPANCATGLPPVSFDKCAPEWRLSEFSHMALGAADTTVFVDWTSAAEWTGRLDQSSLVTGKLRVLTIRGNKPATTKTTITLTRNRVITTERKHVLNITIDEVNDINYDLARTTQCGMQFRVWPITDDTKEMQGGANGILGTLFLEPVYDEGNGAIQKFVGTFEWTSKQDPPRCVNPIAGL